MGLLNHIGVFGALAGGTEKFIAYEPQRMERADVVCGRSTECGCELNRWPWGADQAQMAITQNQVSSVECRCVGKKKN